MGLALGVRPGGVPRLQDLVECVELGAEPVPATGVEDRVHLAGGLAARAGSSHREGQGDARRRYDDVLPREAQFRIAQDPPVQVESEAPPPSSPLSRRLRASRGRGGWSDRANSSPTSGPSAGATQGVPSREAIATHPSVTPASRMNEVGATRYQVYPEASTGPSTTRSSVPLGRYGRYWIESVLTRGSDRTTRSPETVTAREPGRQATRRSVRRCRHLGRRAGAGYRRSWSRSGARSVSAGGRSAGTDRRMWRSHRSRPGGRPGTGRRGASGTMSPDSPIVCVSCSPPFGSGTLSGTSMFLPGRSGAWLHGRLGAGRSGSSGPGC